VTAPDRRSLDARWVATGLGFAALAVVMLMVRDGHDMHSLFVAGVAVGAAATNASWVLAGRLEARSARRGQP